MSAGLDLYRDLVVEHADVPDATVETYLTLAARRHTPTAWGQVYAEAMVWWAADAIEVARASGAISVDPTCAPAAAEAPTSTAPSRFRRLYDDALRSRAAGAPRLVRLC